MGFFPCLCSNLFSSFDLDAFLDLCSSSLESSISINPGDFGAFLGCEVFLSFFPAFVGAFFLLLGLDAFSDFCSSSFESSDSDDFGAFLGSGVFLAFFLLRGLIISISFI